MNIVDDAGAETGAPPSPWLGYEYVDDGGCSGTPNGFAVAARRVSSDAGGTCAPPKEPSLRGAAGAGELCPNCFPSDMKLQSPGHHFLSSPIKVIAARVAAEMYPPEVDQLAFHPVSSRS